jgi:hypothetical protein
MLKSWGEKYLVFYHRKYLFVLCARCLQQKMLLRMKVYKVVTVLYKNLYSISVIKKPYLIRLYVFIMKNNVSSIWFYCSQNFELFCFPIFRFWAYPMKVILSVPNEGYSERTQWRLFWAYPMKVILSVPNEGYFERTQWRLFWAYPMKVILSVPNEGYSERTQWRLFWAYPMKVILSVPNEGYFERTQWRLFWAYPMKVILSVPNEGYFERTQWRLFQRRTMPTKFDIYAFIVIDILCLVYIIF